jgi:hypothetical protein
MKNFVQFALSNFTLTLLVIGLFASGIAVIRTPRPLTTAAIVEALFSYFVLFSIGFFFLYNFIAHTVFAEMSARFIGWENSPFQVELGFASLGFAVIGFLAFRGSFKLRLAAILGPACFLLGAAGVHIHEMVAEHNFAPRNARVIFYTDMLIPLIGFVLLWLQHRSQVTAVRGCD